MELLGKRLKPHAVNLEGTLSQLYALLPLKVSFPLGIVMITYLKVSHMHLSDNIKMHLKAEDYVDKITY